MELDSSPSKRRKISSTASIAIPSNVRESRISARDDGPRSSMSSFMSPTKASLARFNPALLPSPKPASRAAADSVHRRRKSLSPQRLEAPALSPSARAATASPVRRGAAGAGAADSEARRAPPAAKDAGSECLPRGLPTNRIYRSSGASEFDAEPDLPPTPEQLGLEPRSDPPRGLSSSSPLKSKGLRRAGGVGSSPLKQKQTPIEHTRDRPPDEAPDVTQQANELEGRRREAEIRAREKKHKQKRLDQLAEQCQRVQSDITSLQRCIECAPSSVELEPQIAHETL